MSYTGSRLNIEQRDIFCTHPLCQDVDGLDVFLCVALRFCQQQKQQTSIFCPQIWAKSV